ncbi:MAG TPA: class I SAM-dependent methyltransferase [Vicinamibacteria bacterium]|nr:class I SAM-dependent methyltransferase [Vicinamibacteria bacterium]
MPPIDDKLETQKQWNTDPCGAVTAKGLEPGSAAFYARVESERYDVYAPWMRETLGFDAHAGRRILEIGPGLGTDHAQFAREGGQMFALDLTSAHLEHTRRRFAIEGLVTRPARGDAESLPFRDRAFDVVYSFGVIHHTPRMQAAIDEVWRVLKPGGLALVGLYHKHSAFYWIHTILLRGLVLGGLLRKGYRLLLSEIEYRSPGSDAVPLVQVVTRKQCRHLFGRFAGVTIDTRHIDLSHALPFIPASPARTRRVLERVAGRFGWYLIVAARK